MVGGPYWPYGTPVTTSDRMLRHAKLVSSPQSIISARGRRTPKLIIYSQAETLGGKSYPTVWAVSSPFVGYDHVCVSRGKERG